MCRVGGPLHIGARAPDQDRKQRRIAECPGGSRHTRSPVGGRGFATCELCPKRSRAGSAARRVAKRAIFVYGHIGNVITSSKIFVDSSALSHKKNSQRSGNLLASAENSSEAPSLSPWAYEHSSFATERFALLPPSLRKGFAHVCDGVLATSARDTRRSPMDGHRHGREQRSLD